MKLLLLIDASAIMHRAYHALPPLTGGPENTPIQAVYGFFSMVHRTLATNNPDGILFCFDTPKPTFRKKLLPSYQAQRPPAPDDFRIQSRLIREFIDAAGLARAEQPGFEADDLIGTAANHPDLRSYHVRVITGDRDLLQLVTDRVTVELLKTGITKTKSYDPETVYDEYQLQPSQIADLKAIAGDSSDNYQALKGVGPKTATKILHQFGSVEGVLANPEEIRPDSLRAKVLEHREDLTLLKKIASIDTTVNFELPSTLQPPSLFPASLFQLFETYGLNSVKKRFFPDESRYSILRGDQMSLVDIDS